MVDLEMAPSSCCAPERQMDCCESDEKADCCSTEQEGCGCPAGRPEVIQEEPPV